MSGDAPNFLLIDDDPINNLVCESMIKFGLLNARIRTFTNPEEGFEYIRTAGSYPVFPLTILLLDINMPMMSGWDVMDKFAQLDDATLQSIYSLLVHRSTGQGSRA